MIATSPQLKESREKFQKNKASIGELLKVKNIETKDLLPGFKGKASKLLKFRREYRANSS